MRSMRLVLGGVVSTVAAACGGNPPPPACTTGETSLGTINPATPVDYIDLRQNSSGSAPMIVKSAGKPCATASNASACNAALASASSSQEFQSCFTGPLDGCNSQFLAFTRGDTVGTIGTLSDLLAFLGPIDTADEAVLVVSLTQGGNSALVWSCGNLGVQKTPDGWDVFNDTSACGYNAHAQFHVTTAGVVSTVKNQVNETGGDCPVARYMAGVREPSVRARSVVGAYFARMAYFEAASVPAFRTLERELQAHGAPRALRRAARAAAREESRHAALAGGLARRHGGLGARGHVAPPAIRSLEEVAVENAAEGCVRETHGALVATWQARGASDPMVRKVMTRIAREEASHAVLARRVAAWAESRLPSDAVRRVARARDEAIESVRRSAGRAHHADLVRIAGLPNVQVSELLFETMWRQGRLAS